MRTLRVRKRPLRQPERRAAFTTAILDESRELCNCFYKKNVAQSRALAITGWIVTIDAIGCQTEIIELIAEKGGNYVVALKQNQERLYEAVVNLFEDLEAHDYRVYAFDYHKTIDKGHGRTEIRECWTISDPETLRNLYGYDRWKNLTAVCRVRAQRIIGEQHSSEDRFYIASIRDAKQVLQSTRLHWTVENQLHWVLDISFDEDHSRIRKGHGAENLAILRHIALNLLKQESSRKRSIQGKRLLAGWKNDYLMQVLATLFFCIFR